MRGLREIDRILRGEATCISNLREKGLAIQLGQVIVAITLLAAFYGVCLGVYGIANRQEPEFRFMAANAVKVPLLFLLTLVVTFPSLYVFNALVGSRLGVLQLGRLMAAALAVLLAVLASFGPIVAFFSITSTSYPFILLLTVAIFLVAGGFGFDFLWRTLVKWTLHAIPPRTVPPPITNRSESVEPPGPGGPEQAEGISPAGGNRAVIRVFGFWIIAFALVGMQMSWVLRPFIGAPESEFAWFRPRQGSFFEAVARSFRVLFFGS
jgi:hypothetical protein